MLESVCVCARACESVRECSILIHISIVKKIKVDMLFGYLIGHLAM